MKVSEVNTLIYPHQYHTFINLSLYRGLGRHLHETLWEDISTICLV